MDFPAPESPHDGGELARRNGEAGLFQHRFPLYVGETYIFKADLRAFGREGRGLRRFLPLLENALDLVLGKGQVPVGGQGDELRHVDLPHKEGQHDENDQRGRGERPRQPGPDGGDNAEGQRQSAAITEPEADGQDGLLIVIADVGILLHGAGQRLVLGPHQGVGPQGLAAGQVFGDGADVLLPGAVFPHAIIPNLPQGQR